MYQAQFRSWRLNQISRIILTPAPDAAHTKYNYIFHRWAVNDLFSHLIDFVCVTLLQQFKALAAVESWRSPTVCWEMLSSANDKSLHWLQYITFKRKRSLIDSQH